MAVTLNEKIKKQKIDLIIPKWFNHNLIFPNYINLNYDLIILINNDCNIIVPII